MLDNNDRDLRSVGGIHGLQDIDETPVGVRDRHAP
jgi:hypothetical protein